MASASSKQLALLKRLAARTGTSFAYPKNKAQASAEIKRMQEMPRSGPTFAERDIGRGGAYATGRSSKSAEVGSHASYSRHGAAAVGENEPQTLTDSQEQAIIDHQNRTGDDTVSTSMGDATAYLARAFQKPSDGPTKNQLAYLHDLERRDGLPESHPATKLAASRRIDRFANRAQASSVVEDLALAQSLADVSSMHTVAELAQQAGEFSRDDTVHHDHGTDTTINDVRDR